MLDLFAALFLGVMFLLGLVTAEEIVRGRWLRAALYSTLFVGGCIGLSTGF